MTKHTMSYDKQIKISLRRRLTEQVNGLDKSYCIESDKQIIHRLLHLKEYEKSNVVFCYVGRKNEINTKILIQYMLDSGKKVAVPKCIGHGIMEAYIISSLDQLEVGTHGILEPKLEQTIKVSPEQIELAIIPCLSANTKGNRLGYGGGFYDRYLQRTDAYRLVLCRERILYEELPTEDHDQAMHMLLTEDRVLRFHITSNSSNIFA